MRECHPVLRIRSESLHPSPPCPSDASSSRSAPWPCRWRPAPPPGARRGIRGRGPRLRHPDGRPAGPLLGGRLPRAARRRRSAAGPGHLHRSVGRSERGAALGRRLSQLSHRPRPRPRALPLGRRGPREARPRIDRVPPRPGQGCGTLSGGVGLVGEHLRDRSREPCLVLGLQRPGVARRRLPNRPTGPEPVAGGLEFRRIAAGFRSCGVTRDEELYCWGFNAMGQVGDRTSENRLTPTRVEWPR